MRRLLFAGQVLDAATFALFYLVIPAWILERLVSPEANPITAGLFALGGVGAVVVAKIGVASFVVWGDGRRPGRPRVTGAVMAVAMVTGFVGAGSNLLALWTFFEVVGA